MKKINCTALCLAICTSLALPSITYADGDLEYLVKKCRVSAETSQSIVIKNDQIMVKAAGGDKNLDLLYRRSAENMVIVDHRKRTWMIVDEQQVDRIKQQIKDVQPLLQGLGEQIANLSPHQRQKCQELLGDNISLDMITRSSVPPAPTRLVPVGTKKVTGILCRTMRVMQGATPMAAVCLADAAAMKISDNDAATIRGFFGFYERLARKGQGLACQLGLNLPIIAAREVRGIPIEFQDLSDKDSCNMTLRRINTATVSAKRMQIPSNYKAMPLTLWP